MDDPQSRPLPVCRQGPTTRFLAVQICGSPTYPDIHKPAGRRYRSSSGSPFPTPMGVSRSRGGRTPDLSSVPQARKAIRGWSRGAFLGEGRSTASCRFLEATSLGRTLGDGGFRCEGGSVPGGRGVRLAGVRGAGCLLWLAGRRIWTGRVTRLLGSRLPRGPASAP